MDKNIVILQDVHLTPLKIIEHPNGKILHGMKNDESSFSQFGEAYFSMVDEGQVKGWKKHSLMVLNLLVPIGKIQFYLIDGRTESSTFQKKMKITLSIDNYFRLTVPPGYWMAFEGMEKLNMLLNIASIKHDPNEAEVRDLKFFPLS